MIIKGTKENFKDMVLEEKESVLIDFWASWCGPCRMLAPTLDAISEEHPQLKIIKVNVDEQPELAATYQIMSIPTLVSMENGQITHRVSGVQNKEAILKMLKRY